MVKTGYKYLDDINSPKDLRRLSVPELETLAAELRDFMVSELCVNPGHLASSLGAVELAIALHYVYDTPDDKVVWDVGHQAYAHKILTGRREQFHTNRKLGGISGFPRMEESPYDAFGAGHASVSISAALGMAQANKLQGIHRNVIAVIGDGAMTGGLAYEGLNNAGASNADMLVILNDNNMSISPNVGALKEYLLGITTSKHYNRLKNQVWNAMSGVPRMRRAIQNFGNVVKQSILKQSNLFESLNFRYFGPVDGYWATCGAFRARNCSTSLPKRARVTNLPKATRRYGTPPAGSIPSPANCSSIRATTSPTATRTYSVIRSSNSPASTNAS